MGKISGNGEYDGMQHRKSMKYEVNIFTTCPKCARIYGHNYSVAFAQVE
ncbi:MAG: hydrolase [Candidatus Xenobiia bacterium LiM19]